MAVKESVDRLTTRDLQGIWTVLKKWVTETITALKENHLAAEPTKTELIMNTLLILSTMATYTIHNKFNNEPSGLAVSVKAMNESLKLISCKKAGAVVCEMSELYWKTHPELEIPLAINTIHWLISQALQPKATVVLFCKHKLLNYSKKIFLNLGCICEASVEHEGFFRKVK